MPFIHAQQRLHDELLIHQIRAPFFRALTATLGPSHQSLRRLRIYLKENIVLHRTATGTEVEGHSVGAGNAHYCQGTRSQCYTARRDPRGPGPIEQGPEVLDHGACPAYTGL